MKGMKSGKAVKSRQKPSKAVKNRRKAVKSQRKPSDGFLREVTAFDDSTPGKKIFRSIFYDKSSNFGV